MQERGLTDGEYIHEERVGFGGFGEAVHCVINELDELLSTGVGRPISVREL